MSFDIYRGRIYKGFIALGGDNGKQPIIKGWKNLNVYPTYDTLNATEQSIGGVLADNVICIDVDNMNQAERLLAIIKAKHLHCLVVKSRNGKHFYFMNNDHRWSKTTSKLYSAIGILCDPRVNHQMVVKQLGQEREVEYDKTSSDGNYDEFPFWLTPIDNKDRQLFDMHSGEGRNETLFLYRIDLVNNKFSRDMVRETFHIINDHVFADSLMDNEIETICREKAFPQDVFFYKSKFKHNVMGEVIKAQFYIIREGNELYCFNGTHYVEGIDNIRRECITYCEGIRDIHKKEVISYIRDTLESHVITPSDKYVCFKNGLLNLGTWELESFTPDVILFNQNFAI